MGFIGLDLEGEENLAGGRRFELRVELTASCSLVIGIWFIRHLLNLFVLYLD